MDIGKEIAQETVRPTPYSERERESSARRTVDETEYYHFPIPEPIYQLPDKGVLYPIRFVLGTLEMGTSTFSRPWPN